MLSLFYLFIVCNKTVILLFAPPTVVAGVTYAVTAGPHAPALAAALETAAGKDPAAHTVAQPLAAARAKPYFVRGTSRQSVSQSVSQTNTNSRRRLLLPVPRTVRQHVEVELYACSSRNCVDVSK
jgi:hypothetical protein